MKNRIECNLKTFPKHKLSLYEEGQCRGIIEVDDGVDTVIKEFLTTGSPFDDIKLKRQVKKICEMFEPTKITVVSK